jgi:hypothetical protein
MKFSPSTFVKVAAVAVALGAAGAASARGNVSFAIGANVAPGVSIGVSNAPYYGGYYAAPVYAPAPMYAPAPVYMAPEPVYYSAPVTYYETVPGFAPVFINGGYWWGGHRYYRGGGHWMRWEGRGGYGHAGYAHGGYGRHWR